MAYVPPPRLGARCPSLSGGAADTELTDAPCCSLLLLRRLLNAFALVVTLFGRLLFSLSIRDGGNDLHRPPSASAFSSSSSSVPFCACFARSPCSPPAVGAAPRMRAPLLGQAALFAGLMVLSHCLTGSHPCPQSLDCAQAGRHFCQPGSSHCGPCLHPLVEDSRGRCVVKRRHTAHSAPLMKASYGHEHDDLPQFTWWRRFCNALGCCAKMSPYPDLDQEIDFLSAIISEQRTRSRLPAASSPISEPATEPPSDPHRAATEQPMFSSTAPPPTTTNHSTSGLSGPVILPYTSNDQVFIVMTSVFIVASSLALIVAGACWVRLQKGVHFTKKVDYPAYGRVKAQTFDNVPGDKKLAQSAQMYHYQHQKQQMLSLEKHRDEPKVPDSGASTDEENEDGDFTVYECPGLAPTGEMEVKNPLFDDSTLYLHK